MKAVTVGWGMGDEFLPLRCEPWGSPDVSDHLETLSG